MRQDFEGSVYYDEFAGTWGNISRAAGFRGNTVFWMIYILYTMKPTHSRESGGMLPQENICDLNALRSILVYSEPKYTAFNNQISTIIQGSTILGKINVYVAEG